MTSSPQSRAVAIIGHLNRLVEREDRGGLAALRRGLGKAPGATPEMYPHIEPYLDGASKEQADAGYLVASLFGLHPVPWHKPEGAPWNTSFGWSLRYVRLRDDGKENEGVSRRFTAALSCERDALPTHLRQLLTLLRGKDRDAPVNWEQLYWDVLRWDERDRRVQRSWAEGFWRAADARVSESEEASAADDEPEAGED